MTVLALDLGTHTGFALLREDCRIESGTETFMKKAGEGDGGRFLRFKRWLIDTNAAHPLDRIAYERVHHVGKGQAYAAQLYGGFLAIVLMFAETHQVSSDGYQLNVVKKAWTGLGNAPKFEMIARAKQLGFHPKDDNEADAIALLHLATNRVPKLPLGRQVKKPKPRKNPDTATRPIGLDAF